MSKRIYCRRNRVAKNRRPTATMEYLGTASGGRPCTCLPRPFLARLHLMTIHQDAANHQNDFHHGRVLPTAGG